MLFPEKELIKQKLGMFLKMSYRTAEGIVSFLKWQTQRTLEHSCSRGRVQYHMETSTVTYALHLLISLPLVGDFLNINAHDVKVFDKGVRNWMIEV